MSFSPDDLASLGHEALARAGVPEAEMSLRWQRQGIARFGRSVLDQHLDLDEPTVRVRVARGQRVAAVTTNTLSPDGLVEAIRAADALASASPEDPFFPGFLRSDAAATTPVSRYDAATAAVTSAERTDHLGPVFAALRDAGLSGAGALSTSEEAEVLLTTGGLDRRHRGTSADYRVWALETPGAGGASGHGHQLAGAFSTLDVGRETERAIALARLGRDPISLPAGAYDLVLDPAGVAEILDWLALTSFGAREVDEGSALVAGRRGQAVMGPAITLRDEPLGGLSLVPGFDREGSPRRVVSILDRGVAEEVLSDRRWAKRAGGTALTTGNAGNSAGADAPVAGALVLAGGDAADVDELIRGVSRGLYVCRLHYVNGLLEPRRAVMTGMSRDGAFLIEDGRITRPVGNLRFTESLAEASFRVDGLTRTPVLSRSMHSAWFGGNNTIACPAVRFRQFTFTSGSQPAVDLGG